MIHKQKPCGMIGDTACGNFEKGDLVTNVPEEVKVTCTECTLLTGSQDGGKK